jgi:hypothetical protein
MPTSQGDGPTKSANAQACLFFTPKLAYFSGSSIFSTHPRNASSYLAFYILLKKKRTPDAILRDLVNNAILFVIQILFPSDDSSVTKTFRAMKCERRDQEFCKREYSSPSILTFFFQLGALWKWQTAQQRSRTTTLLKLPACQRFWSWWVHQQQPWRWQRQCEGNRHDHLHGWYANDLISTLEVLWNGGKVMWGTMLDKGGREKTDFFILNRLRQTEVTVIYYVITFISLQGTPKQLSPPHQ